MSMVQSSSGLLAAGALLAILLFISWIGFGYLMTRLLKIPPLPWGQSASIGMAAVIFLGGVQALFGTVSASANYLILIIGAVFFFAWLRKSRKRLDTPGLFKSLHSKRDMAFAVAFVVLRLAALFVMGSRIIGALYPHWWNIADDMGAYFAFPKMMLETHTLIEPFNLRRLATLGGAVYLQTFLYPLLSFSALPVTDSGLGIVLIWAVTLGFFKKEGDLPRFYFKREFAGFMALLFSSAVLLLNYNPVLIPFALILCLVSLFFSLESKEADWRHVLLISILCGLIITIRNNFMAFVLVFAFLNFFVFGKGPAERGQRVLSQSALFIGALILYLAPWMLLLYKSNGTLFFPLMKGNFTFPNGFSEPLDTGEKIAFIWKNLLYSSSPLIVISFIGVAVLFKRRAPLIITLVAAIFAAVAATSLSLSGANSGDIVRYCQPFSYAGLLAMFIISFADKTPDSSREARSAKAFKFLSAALIIIWFFLPYKIEAKWNEAFESFTCFPENIAVGTIAAFFGDSTDAIKKDFLGRFVSSDAAYYYEVQHSLPYGSRVISAADWPCYWDYRLQDIHTLDEIGWASPPPGMPFFQGADKMADYFRNLGYQYLVYTPSDISIALYSRKMWDKKYNNYIWSHWALYIRDYINNIEQLEKEGLVVYSTPTLRVISLKGRN